MKYQILITYADDLRAINVAFNRFQKRGLRLSITKCSFCLKKFEYLGVIVSRQSIQPSPRNVDKIIKCKCESISDLRSFVGIAQFYRRWIKDFSQIVKVLYDAIKDKMTPLNILGNTILKDAISKIKQALTTYPVMHHPDFNKKFLLATDGSLFGFGSVLFQETDDGSKYVVAYASWDCHLHINVCTAPNWKPLLHVGQ